jgi:hypothetical protein
MRYAFIFPLILSAAVAFAADEPAPLPRNADPIVQFERRYEQGAAAVLDKNWLDACRHLEAAMELLGPREHLKRPVAEILLKKAKEESRRQRALFTAQELLRLKQWEEARVAFIDARNELGDLPEIQQGLSAIDTGREMELRNTPVNRELAAREIEYHAALQEARQLARAQKFDNALIFARRANTLKPDDPVALQMLTEIKRHLRGSVGEQDPLDSKPEGRGETGEKPDKF